MSSYGLWLSAAGMKVNEHRQALLANNMANAHTTGFKQDLAVIRARPVESREMRNGLRLTHPVLDGMTGGVNIRPSHHNFAQAVYRFRLTRETTRDESEIKDDPNVPDESRVIVYCRSSHPANNLAAVVDRDGSALRRSEIRR